MSIWTSPEAAMFAEYFDLKYPGLEAGELDYMLR